MSEAMRHWRRHDDPQGITWLIIDCADASSNTLGREVLEELDRLLAPLESHPPRGVIVCSGKPSGFIVGADIREFEQLADEQQAYAMVRQGQGVINRLARLKCPTVAMIRGHALGGGLELAMACRYRVCADADRGTLGLPEVQLGIHPGFGGTVRPVHLVGVPAAMDLMLTGRSLRPARARSMGLIDRVVPEEDLEDAARALVHRPPPPRRAPLQLRVMNLPGIRQLVARRLRREVGKKARREHYPAPWEMIDLWVRHGARGDAAYDAEARSIARLFVTPTSRNLVRVYFLQDRMKGLAQRDAAQVKRLHVVGAGVMGGDIATWSVLQGLDVTLQDREQKILDAARERAGKQFEKRLRGKDAVADAHSRLRTGTDVAAAADAEVVIEAIVERLDAKQSLFGELEATVEGSALLATNTSSIRLESIGETMRESGRLVGLHFFNPVAQLPLVEVIRAEHSDGDAVQRAIDFARQIGKLPLPCASSPGFLVNRILAPYMNEAMHLHEEGVALELIDEAARAFGMPMGPVELADTVGLDVGLHVAEILGEAFDRPVPESLRGKVDAGELGRKSGQGFYTWRDGKAQKGDVAGKQAPEDLEDRLILPMLNEAVACLAEGVVDDEDLLDAGVIFGTGFAPFRGGPLHHARSRGLDTVQARLEALAERHGERFRAHAHWAQLDP